MAACFPYMVSDIDNVRNTRGLGEAEGEVIGETTEGGFSSTAGVLAMVSINVTSPNRTFTIDPRKISNLIALYTHYLSHQNRCLLNVNEIQCLRNRLLS